MIPRVIPPCMRALCRALWKLIERGAKMKRIIFVVLVAAELFVLLCACGGAQEAPCRRPRRTLFVQCGETAFGRSLHGRYPPPDPPARPARLFEKAEELGYEGHILGLEDGGMQELFDCWLQGAREYDIAGAVCWVGDESAYEFLKGAARYGRQNRRAALPA